MYRYYIAFCRPTYFSNLHNNPDLNPVNYDNNTAVSVYETMFRSSGNFQQ